MPKTRGKPATFRPDLRVAARGNCPNVIQGQVELINDMILLPIICQMASNLSDRFFKTLLFYMPTEIHKTINKFQ